MCVVCVCSMPLIELYCILFFFMCYKSNQLLMRQNNMCLINCVSLFSYLYRLVKQVVFDSERIASAKDAMQTETEDFYDIYDPRNPLNVRRREKNNNKKNK